LLTFSVAAGKEREGRVSLSNLRKLDHKKRSRRRRTMAYLQLPDAEHTAEVVTALGGVRIS
jgi:hypothetical protein